MLHYSFEFQRVLGRMGSLVDVVGLMVLNIVSSGRHYQSISSRLCVSEVWSLSSPSLWLDVESDISAGIIDSSLDVVCIHFRVHVVTGSTLPYDSSLVGINVIFRAKRLVSLDKAVKVAQVI